MNPPSIQPINAIQQADSNTSSKVMVQVEPLAQNQSTTANPERPQPEAKVETKTDQLANMTNISIHFRIEEETNNVTIFLVDRKSKKVLRTIPAGELRKLQVGDILKLTA